MLERSLLFCCTPHFQLQKQKIFVFFSEPLCWIITKNHILPHGLLLLNDFLVVTPQSSPPRLSLTTLTKAFSELSVPFSEEKTTEPCISIDFWGISWTPFLSRHIYPWRKYSLSLCFCQTICLQTDAQMPDASPSRPPQFCHMHNSLRDTCKTEMHFLSSWNCISFFYTITQPQDIQLNTDAEPSIVWLPMFLAMSDIFSAMLPIRDLTS